MILVIDNYDSFVFNVVRYFEELGEMVEVGPDAVAGLPAARLEVLQGEVAGAFRAAFLVICGFCALAAATAWSIPMRRLS